MHGHRAPHPGSPGRTTAAGSRCARVARSAPGGRIGRRLSPPPARGRPMFDGGRPLPRRDRPAGKRPQGIQFGGVDDDPIRGYRAPHEGRSRKSVKSPTGSPHPSAARSPRFVARHCRTEQIALASTSTERRTCSDNNRSVQCGAGWLRSPPITMGTFCKLRVRAANRRSRSDRDAGHRRPPGV